MPTTKDSGNDNTKKCPSRFGTPLLAAIQHYDRTVGKMRERHGTTTSWQSYYSKSGTQKTSGGSTTVSTHYT